MDNKLARFHLPAVDKMKTHIEDWYCQIAAQAVDLGALLSWGKGCKPDWGILSYSEGLDPPMLVAIGHMDGLGATGGPPATLRVSSPRFRRLGGVGAGLAAAENEAHECASPPGVTIVAERFQAEGLRVEGSSVGAWKQNRKGLLRPGSQMSSFRRSRRFRLRNLPANQCTLCQKNLDSRRLRVERLERQYLKSLLRL